MRFIFNQVKSDTNTGIEFWQGDEQWRSSIHITFKWFGKKYWLLIFI